MGGREPRKLFCVHKMLVRPCLNNCLNLTTCLQLHKVLTSFACSGQIICWSQIVVITQKFKCSYKALAVTAKTRRGFTNPLFRYFYHWCLMYGGVVSHAWRVDNPTTLAKKHDVGFPTVNNLMWRYKHSYYLLLLGLVDKYKNRTSTGIVTDRQVPVIERLKHVRVLQTFVMEALSRSQEILY